MSSKKDYRDYILEQMSVLEGITFRPMMGELEAFMTIDYSSKE